MDSPTIAISGAAALECVRALAAGLSDEARVRLLAESLPVEIRREAFKEALGAHTLLTAAQAGELVQWTGQGFARVAKRENCPSIRLGQRQPELYRLRDVEELFARMRIWPKGRPLETEPTNISPMRVSAAA